MTSHLLERTKALNEAFKNLHSIQHIADLILSSINAGNRIFTIGNGGSASQSQHLSAELLGRFSANRIPIACYDLTSNPSTLTCISNDFGYETVFSRQLEALANPGDLLFAFSTSGESPNILKAVDTALQRKSLIISITSSFKPNSLFKQSTHSLGVNSADVAIIQEATLLYIHLICMHIDAILPARSSSALDLEDSSTPGTSVEDNLSDAT